MLKENLSSRKPALAHVQTKNQEQYLRRWCQSVVSNDVPCDYGPRVAFVSRVSDPFVAEDVGLGGRELSVAIPFSFLKRKILFTNKSKLSTNTVLQ